MLKFIVLPFMILGLTSCSTSRDFIDSATRFLSPDTVYNNQVSVTENAKPMAQWWETLNDPFINQNIDRLLIDNLDLQQAAERIIQSQELVTQARSSLFPTLSASGSAGRSFTNSPLTNNRTYTNSYEAGLNTTWQLDLFGQIKDQAKIATFNAQANLYDREALQHALIAQFIQSRIRLSILNDQIKLAKSNLSNRKRFYDLTRNRYDIGAANIGANEVFLAKRNYESVQADLKLYERLAMEESYILDILLGQKPGTLIIPDGDIKYTTIPSAFENQTCLPLALLDRRPDLKSSAMRLNAAATDIDVAIANLYPSVSLSGFLGFSATNDNDLFDTDNLAASILAQITNRLFEGGALRSNIRLQESEARELSLAYNESILNALKDVETAAYNETNYRDQLRYQMRSVQSLRKAEDISKDRYGRGLETLQNYLNTEQTRYSANINLYNLYQEAWMNRISLYLALGGDWFGAAKSDTTCQQMDISS